MQTENKTEVVRGQRLQVTCRALGLPYKEDGEWVKNSSRYYPNRWVVTGVKLSPEDAAKLRAHLEEKKAKAKARAAKLADPNYLKNRAETKAKREKKAIDKIEFVVNSRWMLPAEEVREFSVHANETGSGRVLRTTSSCVETFETKVYMALVAWVRHNKTTYERDLRTANDDAWSEANSLRPDFDAGENWSDRCESEREEYEEAKNEARRQCDRNRNELHFAKTEEAVKWLSARETDLGKMEREAREAKKAAQSVNSEPHNSSDESVSPFLDGCQPMTEAGCSLAVAG